MTEKELTDLINEFAETSYFRTIKSCYENRYDLMFSPKFSSIINGQILGNFAIYFLHNYNKISVAGTIYRLGCYCTVRKDIEISELNVEELRDFLNEQILNLKFFQRKEKLKHINQDFENDR